MKANLLKILCFCCCLSNFLFAQNDSLSQKLRKVALWTSAGYTVGMGGLSVAWYSKMETAGFHFFDDNDEWLQMDKCGHSFTTFHLSRSAYKVFRNVGVPHTKAALWGGVTGFVMLSSIEVADGFMAGYGASWGDLLANLAGSSLMSSQELLWRELRLKPKFSFRQSHLAAFRPNVLGSNFLEQLIKDYNGQTYWLSVDLYAFLKNTYPKFPKWLNLSLGYGASEMLYGRADYNRIVKREAYRRFFVGIDPDLSYIKSKSKFVNTLIFLVDMIRLPLPALEYSQGEWKYFIY